MRVNYTCLRTAIPLAAVAFAAIGACRPASSAGAGSRYLPHKRGTLTFAHDIAPIVYKNCASCHHAGEVAPFSLTSYDDVKKRADEIAVVTGSRFMPPWKAVSPAPTNFYDAHYLSNEQIGEIKQWADEGAREGDRATEPVPPSYEGGWTLGKPDIVLEPKADYTLAAEGNDVYRCFILPTGTTTNRYVAALEVQPANPKIVHHVIAYYDNSGRGRKMEAENHDGQIGYTSFGGVGFMPTGALGGWVPGNEARRAPAGTGTYFPAGSDVVLQVHYHKDGKVEKDRTRIGIYFCSGPIDKRVRIFPILYPNLDIPPGDADYTVHRKVVLPGSVSLIGVMPHMHLLGKAMTLTATLPNGVEKTLIDVPNYDFNWQTTYNYRQPIELPAGTTINLVARYDNSENNPSNPSRPPKHVGWGEQTTDEMCIGFLWYTVDAEHITQGKLAPGVFGLGTGKNGWHFITQMFRDSAPDSAATKATALR